MSRGERERERKGRGGGEKYKEEIARKYWRMSKIAIVIKKKVRLRVDSSFVFSSLSYPPGINADAILHRYFTPAFGEWSFLICFYCL